MTRKLDSTHIEELIARFEAGEPLDELRKQGAA